MRNDIHWWPKRKKPPAAEVIEEPKEKVPFVETRGGPRIKGTTLEYGQEPPPGTMAYRIYHGPQSEDEELACQIYIAEMCALFNKLPCRRSEESWSPPVKRRRDMGSLGD